MTDCTRSAVAADRARCTGCKTCLMVCSLVHEGEVAPELARLRVEWEHFHEPNPTIALCLQCADAPCADACPSEAIVFDPDIGVLIVHAEECTACEICVDACEYGMIRVFPDVPGRALKCDLCGGRPRCVEHCPQGALSLARSGA